MSNIIYSHADDLAGCDKDGKGEDRGPAAVMEDAYAEYLSPSK